jgi:hypothetical protein
LQYLGQSIAQAGQQFAQIPILREQANRQRIQDERDTLKFGKEMEAADLNTQYIKTNMAATQASTQAAQEKAAQGQRNLSDEADLSAALQGDPEAGARLVQLVVAEMQKAGFQINPPTTREQAGLQGPSAQTREGMGMEQALPQAPAGLNPQLRPQASTPMVGMGSMQAQSPMAARRQQLGQEALDEMASMQYQGMGDMAPGAKYTSLSSRFSGSQSPVVEKAIDRAQEDMQNEALMGARADAAGRAAEGDGGPSRLDRNSTDRLRKEFTARPMVAATTKISGTANKVRSALDTYKAAKGADKGSQRQYLDQILMVNFNKMLDENSAVLPGEFDRTAKGAGLSQEFINKFRSAVDGGLNLNDTQREALVRAIEGTERAVIDEAKSDYEYYGSLAERYGEKPYVITGGFDKFFKPEQPAAKAAVPGSEAMNVGRFKVRIK